MPSLRSDAYGTTGIAHNVPSRSLPIRCPQPKEMPQVRRELSLGDRRRCRHEAGQGGRGMKFTVNETLERLSAFGGELVEVIGLLAWRFENRSPRIHRRSRTRRTFHAMAGSGRRNARNGRRDADSLVRKEGCCLWHLAGAGPEVRWMWALFDVASRAAGTVDQAGLA